MGCDHFVGNQLLDVGCAAFIHLIGNSGAEFCEVDNVDLGFRIGGEYGLQLLDHALSDVAAVVPAACGGLLTDAGEKPGASKASSPQ